MARIEKRSTADGSVSWRARVRKQGYPERNKTFRRKTDAEAWARSLEQRIDRSQSIPDQASTRRTVAEAIDRYLNETLPFKKSNRDQKNVKTRLHWWKDQLGTYALYSVTPAEIVECRDALRKGRQPATVNRYLSALSAVFRTAVDEWYWLEDSPMRRVRKLGEPKGRTRFLNDDERDALLRECKASDSVLLYPVVVLALSTGMRQGEVLSLTWQQVGLKRQKITLFDTKNDETRVVPLKGLALDVMREHGKVRHIDSPYVFPSKDGSKPAEIRQSWCRALKRAGIKDFRFHDLRHSAASYLAMSGASLAEIAEVLGHRTLQMVKRYSHFTEQHTAGIVGRMNERFFGNAK